MKSDERAHLGIAETHAHRRPDAGNEGRVEQLAHGALEADPMQDVAGARIDNIGAAARLAVALLDVVVELEPLESAVARKRCADQRVSAPE